MQATATRLDIRRTARRGLAIYFAIVLALSAPIEGFLIANPRLDGLIALLMFVPTWLRLWRASCSARASRTSPSVSGERAVGAPSGSRRLSGAIGTRCLRRRLDYGSGRVRPLPSAGWPRLPFAVGMVDGLIFASGEEIGWRGYMLTRLIDAGVPRPVLTSGLIWGLWHVPLVLGGVYAAGPSPALSAA